MLPCHSCYIYGTWRSKEVGAKVFKVIVWREAEAEEGEVTKSKGCGNFYGWVEPLSILSELPSYFSLFWCKKSSMVSTT